jgi:3-oxoacyl-[acyl-carrier-protein] synthase-1
MKLAARVEGVGLVGPGLPGWAESRAILSGAQRAMQAALERAGIGAQDIDYVNLHGTGTQSNDSSEDRAFVWHFGEQVPVNYTMVLSVHELGAAGGVEAVLSALAMEEGLIPASPGTREVDPALRARYEKSARPASIRRVLSNSFGFGGSNCSLVLGRAAA